MRMKKLIVIYLLFFGTVAQAQFHELGVFLGSSNYRGDVGNSMLVMPSSYGLGVVYRWNITTRYALRAGLNYGKIKGIDYRANDLGRFLRGYSFDNTLGELFLGAEINFVDFNLHAGDTQFTPYLTVGASYVDFDAFYFAGPPPAASTQYDAQQSFALPVIVGAKFNPNPLWVIGFEVGLRYALTDNLDGSTPIEEFEFAKFGNLHNNDWYIFSGITISFTFGDLPCYCKEN